jgi:hypothetical protein
MWDRRVVEKMEVWKGRFIIACSFRCESDNFEWAFASVYGPNDDHKRKHMSDKLVGSMSWWEKPWCIGRDFNVIRSPSERSGDNRYSSSMGEFSDFIIEQRLMDSPLVGSKFTWSNNQDVQCWSRIDRFLFSPAWEEQFPNAIQRRLPRL